jgi:hypothetical protein
MQGLDAVVELVTARLKQPVFGLVVRPRKARVRGQRRRQRLRDLSPGADPAVKVEHQVAQTDLVQPLQDRVDGGALLGHEQHALAAGDERGDEVGDGLALARARRSLDDEVLAGEDGVDGVVLAGVSVPDQELVGGRRVVWALGVHRGPALAHGRPCLVLAGQCRDEVVGDHRLPASSRCP